MTSRLAILVDADACPVKEEIYKVAERHGADVVIVSNSYIRIPLRPFITQQVVDAGPDVADDWIAERAGPATVVVTADILLAERCVRLGAPTLSPAGKPFTASTITAQVATRAILEGLRSTGEITGGPAPFGPKDRSRFLSALHETLEKMKRGR